MEEKPREKSTKTPKRQLDRVCGLHYEEYWKKCNIDHTMSQEEFDAWLKKYCYQCAWMSDICMFGES